MNLKEIQQNLKNQKIDAIIIPRNNHFLGQDILDCENKISELTGFDGSAGTLIVTSKKAHLFVDGRYQIQAAKQTDCNEVEIICGKSDAITQWIAQNLANSKIVYNSWTISIRDINDLKRYFPNIKFVDLPTLAPTPKATVFEHDIAFSGKSSADKINQIRPEKKNLYFIAAADSVSWLTNLRSNALPQTPIIRAMAMVDDNNNCTIFGDNLEIPEHIAIACLPLTKIEEQILKYPNHIFNLDYNKTPDAILQILQKHKIKKQNITDPCQALKACKNPTELQGFYNAHLRDGVAVCRFLHWLDGNYRGNSELSISQKLYEFRSEQKNFWSESFTTIAAVNENAAIVHYHPTEKSNKELVDGSILLLDSGAQYFDATTDVTRTIAIRTATQQAKEKYTIVLKAHIALALQKFPPLTSGVRMDAICRSKMWQYDLDYNHGTGHGVGCFLNVHEGPQSLGPYSSLYPLQENMIISIEPGYYQENHFGIRIENLVVIEKSDSMLKFSPLTLIPLDKSLIDKYLLSKEEEIWLNQYHQLVYDEISPFLNNEEKNWLKDKCQAL